jgi:hypothetical protein
VDREGGVQRAAVLSCVVQLAKHGVFSYLKRSCLEMLDAKRY